MFAFIVIYGVAFANLPGSTSLPYLDGQELELFNFEDNEIHCYWLIPITKGERDYKVENGYEALEQLFEEKSLDYINPNRKCLVTGR